MATLPYRPRLADMPIREALSHHPALMIDGPREIMTEVCPTCAGVGVIPSDETHAITVERHLRQSLRGKAADAVTVLVNPRIADVLSSEDGERLADLEAEVGVKITLQREPSMSLHDSKVQGGGDAGKGNNSGGGGTSTPAAKEGDADSDAKPSRGASARRRVSSRTSS